MYDIQYTVIKTSNRT